MKIVQILPELGKGGAERVVVDLANQFAANGHEVTIVAAYPVDDALRPGAIADGVAIRYMRRRPGRVARYAAVLPWVLREWPWLSDQDVLHCHLSFGSAAGTAVSAVRRVRGADHPKVVETYHAIGSPLSGFDRRVHRTLSATHDAVVAMAEDADWTRFVRDHPELLTAMIPNGIAFDAPRPSCKESAEYRAAAGIPAGVPVLGTVGRLVPERRPDAFMQVFERVAEAVPLAHFLMAGDGPEATRLKSFAREAGLGDRIHFPGLVLRPALPFSIMDLYLTLNVGAITGIAALEAAAAGLPLVAVQANADHDSGQSDWIFSSTDPAAIAAEAVRLLNSDSERSALADRQRRHVLEHHSADAMAAAYLRIYERLLASG